MTYFSAQTLKDAPAGQTPSTPQDADQPRHERQGQGHRDRRPRREAAGTDTPKTAFILTLASDPLPGIIAAVTTVIADLGGNITETHQHWDRPTASSCASPSSARKRWPSRPSSKRSPPPSRVSAST